MLQDPEYSPTTTIRRVLITLGVSFCLALILGGKGLVHSGEGMQDGPLRTATLALGNSIVAVTEPVGLTWPWDRLQIALGRAPEQNSAPLAQGGPLPSDATPDPTRIAVLTTPTKHDTHGKHGRNGRNGRNGTHRRVAIPTPRPTPTPLPLRRPTAQNPLRLLVTGDSLPGFLGPQLINALSAIGPVNGNTDVHDGTGLTRPDFVDWSVVAQQQVARYHPDAVVVLMGGNDFQNETLSNGQVLIAGTSDWTREYQRRAEICMRIWAQGGHAKVYWLSMPPARDPGWAADDRQIDIALQRAAPQVPGVEYVNILGPITNHGQYTDFVNVGGSPTLIRESDGVHLNEAGSQIVANMLVPVLKRDWHIGYVPPTPAPAPPRSHRRTP